MALLNHGKANYQMLSLPSINLWRCLVHNIIVPIAIHWIHFVDVVFSVSIQSKERESEERRGRAESEGRSGGVLRQIQFICKSDM